MRIPSVRVLHLVLKRGNGVLGCWNTKGHFAICGLWHSALLSPEGPFCVVCPRNHLPASPRMRSDVEAASLPGSHHLQEGGERTCFPRCWISEPASPFHPGLLSSASPLLKLFPHPSQNQTSSHSGPCRLASGTFQQKLSVGESRAKVPCSAGPLVAHPERPPASLSPGGFIRS